MIQALKNLADKITQLVFYNSKSINESETFYAKHQKETFDLIECYKALRNGETKKIFYKVENINDRLDIIKISTNVFKNSIDFLDKTMCCITKFNTFKTTINMYDISSKIIKDNRLIANNLISKIINNYNFSYLYKKNKINISLDFKKIQENKNIFFDYDNLVKDYLRLSKNFFIPRNKFNISDLSDKSHWSPLRSTIKIFVNRETLDKNSLSYNNYDNTRNFIKLFFNKNHILDYFNKKYWYDFNKNFFSSVEFKNVFGGQNVSIFKVPNNLYTNSIKFPLKSNYFPGLINKITWEHRNVNDIINELHKKIFGTEFEVYDQSKGVNYYINAFDQINTKYSLVIFSLVAILGLSFLLFFFVFAAAKNLKINNYHYYLAKIKNEIDNNFSNYNDLKRNCAVFILFYLYMFFIHFTGMPLMIQMIILASLFFLNLISIVSYLRIFGANAPIFTKGLVKDNKIVFNSVLDYITIIIFGSRLMLQFIRLGITTAIFFLFQEMSTKFANNFIIQNINTVLKKIFATLIDFAKIVFEYADMTLNALSQFSIYFMSVTWLIPFLFTFVKRKMKS